MKKELYKKYIIYIDAANILMAFKECDIDMISILTFFTEKYKGSSIKYFTGYFKNDNFLYTEIEALNCEIIYKKIYNEAFKIKANCDVEISHAITKDLLLDQKLTDIVLLSGDGDFNSLIDFSISLNKKVTVYPADPRSCSKIFKNRNDIKLTYLIDMKEKFRNEKPPLDTDVA